MQESQLPCVFSGVNSGNLILSPQSAMSSGSLLMSEGVNTSLAISVEENLFLFVATANTVEKVSVTVPSIHWLLLLSASLHCW